jgi:hypothetical protein
LRIPTVELRSVLTIGPLKIQMPAIQAALSGFSDGPMRAVARRYGAEFAMAEVVRDKLVVLKGSLRTRLIEIAEDDPIGGQHIDRRPEQFAERQACAISPTSVAEQRDAIEFQLTQTLKLHDAEHVGRAFRKFRISYGNLHPMRNEVRQPFTDARNTFAIHEILASWYDNQREWPEARPPEMLRDPIAAGAER